MSEPAPLANSTSRLGAGQRVPVELERRLVALRRDLHQHPELSFKEERTASVLAQTLGALGVANVTRVAGTGLVARVAGRDSGAPLVAVRGDIDALPIQEATGLSFASATAGVMHACGHDVHATWTVGAAALLRAEPPAGDVLVVLQPAEETGKGARAMLETGALDNVQAIFGAHVDRRFVVGQVVAQAGPLAASADTFEIELVGRGAHAARPHEAADPIVGAAALIGALQTIVARRVNPASPAVVTIGVLSAGTAPNIIPDRALLRGTLRAADAGTRAVLHAELRSISTHIAAAHGLEARVAIDEGVPPVINSADAAAWAADAVTALFGPEAVVPLGATNMAGEDFACYLEHTRGCFLRVGALGDGEPMIAAHSPAFDVAEEAISVGAAVLAECARRASAALAGSVR
ncbi:MAG: M20 family metallopeptidase [Gemmatimonadaceae bacterium]